MPEEQKIGGNGVVYKKGGTQIEPALTIEPPGAPRRKILFLLAVGGSQLVGGQPPAEAEP